MEQDQKFQRKYAELNPYCEIQMAFRREFLARDDIHEILHGSSRTFEDWNMIALTRENHNRYHLKTEKDGGIPRRIFFIAKIINGTLKNCPDDIVRRFRLGLLIRNEEKFRRRWLIHVYHKI